jgi:hypothetical protein
MSTSVTWNGSSYTVPSTSEENWSGATKVDGLLIALVNHGFQKTGGTFTLSADADFGVTAGLKSVYYKSRGTVATTGVLRLGNAEVIAWMNAAGNANIPLTVNSSDQLTFNGTVVFSSSGVVPIAAGGTGAITATLGFDALSPMSALGDLIYGGAAGTRTRLAGNTTTTLKYLVQTGDGAASAVPAWTQGAFSHLSGNATVAQGGTNLTSYTAGDMLYATGATTIAKLGIGTAGQILKTNGGATAPEWGAASSALSYLTRTHANTGYTILNTDDFILWTLTDGNNNTATLPACSGNSGKKFIIKLAATTASFNTLTVSRAGSDTITLADGTTGATSIVFYTGGETYELVSDGTSVWQVLNHRTETAWTTPTAGGGFIPDSTAFGTLAVNQFSYRRVGDTCEVSGYFQCGSLGAAAMHIVTPFTIDTTKVCDTSGRQACGHYFVSETSNQQFGSTDNLGVCFFDPAETTKIYLAQLGGSTTGILTKTNGSATSYANTSAFHVMFKFPVSGWKA